MSAHHDEKDVEEGGSRKSLPAYLSGYGLSILLTMLAFGLVMQHTLSNTMLYSVLAMLAITQLIVQSICFLRLNTSPEGRWNLLPFLFVILIITILMSGSLWIMYNLNYNMMN
jgi:cytochrome o ubiquinol oxidase operon protein cyoD